MDKKTTSKQDLIKQNKILKKTYQGCRNTVKELRAYNDSDSFPQKIKDNQIAIKSNQIKRLESKIKQQQLQIKNLKYRIQQKHIYTLMGEQLTNKLGWSDYSKITKASYNTKQSEGDKIALIEHIFDKHRVNTYPNPHLKVTDQKLIKSWTKNTLNYKKNKIDRIAYIKNANHMFKIYESKYPTKGYYITSDDIANALDKLASKYVSKHTKTRQYNHYN